MDISASRRRQGGLYGRFPAARPSRQCRSPRCYFENAIDQNGEPETITVDKSGAKLAALEALNAERPTPIKIRQKIPEQCRRAGPPRHQAQHQTDDEVQGFPLCTHHPLRHRDCAHDPQGTMCDDGVASNTAEQFYPLAMSAVLCIEGTCSPHPPLTRHNLFLSNNGTAA